MFSRVGIYSCGSSIVIRYLIFPMASRILIGYNMILKEESLAT
jgi:hypothetical protein